MSRRRSALSTEVLRFALAGLVAFALLGLILLLLLSKIATSEALRSAREGARLAGYGIIEPAVSADLLGTPDTAAPSIGVLDELVGTRVLSERVVRVKIWTLEGRIVYSDEPRLVGMTYKPKEDHAEAVATGEIGAEIASTTGPENEFERDFGQLLEVYMPLRAPDGTPLVYEQYETYDSIVGDSRQLMWRLALPLLGCVALLWLVQLPLARRLASRVRAAQEQHASLAEAAVTASTRERERIAVELHDGVVQDLAGLTYELSALGSRTTEPEAKAALVRSADIARTAMQQVRSSLVDLHPGTIDALGLEAAIEQLAEPLRRRGMDVGVQIDSTTLPIGAQALFYRVARELLRNVDEHANAARADVTLMTDASGATLVVSDNGTGIDNEALSRRRADGHVGLDLHRAVVAHQGGTMDIDSTAGSGTSVSVRLPL